eukprot:CAMPEP_0184672054 /NCGR_PEP_ID=MMETSP0308-20130426/85870_1 /TAXON_ID=38269 /ORGANISM="Gloeochaete witrockiana, Strain SAG 46.84" /LENGTH=74 /DNA_ID=CAMNT_0027119305 /DNA_START=1489 /DNA_END=1713 /DNA_ORIENTATION=-
MAQLFGDHACAPEFYAFQLMWFKRPQYDKSLKFTHGSSGMGSKVIDAHSRVARAANQVGVMLVYILGVASNKPT